MGSDAAGDEGEVWGLKGDVSFESSLDELFIRCRTFTTSCTIVHLPLTIVEAPCCEIGGYRSSSKSSGAQKSRV